MIIIEEILQLPNSYADIFLMPVMISRSEIRPWIEDDARLPDFLGRGQSPLLCEQDSGQISFMFE